jgi:hypothetical protein
MTTTARQDVRAGLYALLVAFQAANPTLLFSVFRARPGAPGVELPGAFVGNLNEQFTHTAGTRQRNFSPEIVIFDSFAPSNEEQAARIDLVQDALMDYLTANPNAVAHSILALNNGTSTDGEFDIVGGQVTTHYRAVAIGLGQITIMEGRN